MRSSRPISPLFASCWLALILIAAKAVTWNEPWPPHLGQRLVALLMSSWTDVAFALTCGVIGEALVRASGRWPAVASLLRVVIVAFFAICSLYAVVAVGLFRYYNRPVTAAMFGLISNAGLTRAYVADRLTLPIAATLVLLPLVFLLLAFATRRVPRLGIVLVALLTIWGATGWWMHKRWWDHESQLTHLWLSPHVEVLRTSLARLTDRTRTQLPSDYPPEYVDEFRNFGARRGRADFFQPPADATRPRNVVFVVLESVGAKYLRLYGSELDVMPNLERETRNALVFDNIYAHASFTYCSFRTLLFSVYPGLPWHYSLLGDGRPLPGTLAGALRARGSRTAYINNSVLYWEDLHWLLTNSRAFERLDDYSTVGCPPLTEFGTEDRCVFERLISWIDEKPTEPFFAICWTDQTHHPYPLGPGVTPMDFFAGRTPPPFARDLNAYLNVIHETDRHLGRMFDALRERGLADDTLVVVTGDHGEAFADPHAQRGHVWSVFEEETRVPLVIWNPRLFPEGKRVATIGGHVDVNPTIVDLLGLPPDPEWQGHSLFDPAKPNRVMLMAIAEGDVFGVREAEWKYVFNATSGRESLFNLELDPREQRDVAADEPERAWDLRRRVAAWVAFEDAYLWRREN